MVDGGKEKSYGTRTIDMYIPQLRIRVGSSLRHKTTGSSALVEGTNT